MVFAQESIKRFFEDNGEKTLAEGGGKKGTLIFTGTLGALRTNAEFGSYGASRSSVRMLAQALAKEMSPKGVHVAHAIANGGFELSLLVYVVAVLTLLPVKDVLPMPIMRIRRMGSI